MTEFQPENTTPDPRHSANGAAPYAPNLAQQPAPPAPPYGGQPPTPSYGGQPPTPSYGGQPYGGQPYGQPASMAAAPQNAEWGAPPPAWNSAPPKKRKVWPWVLGGIGAVVVLGVAAVVGFFVIGTAAVDAVNPNYDAPPVAAGDVATTDGTIMVVDNAHVAFEVGPQWTDQTDQIFGASNPVTDTPINYASAWTTVAEPTAEDATVVMILTGTEARPLVLADLKKEHNDFIKSFLDGAGSSVDPGDSSSYTTAYGLKGLRTAFTIDVNGLTTACNVFSFVRGDQVVFVGVFSYTGVPDDAAADQIVGTLRIEK